MVIWIKYTNKFLLKKYLYNQKIIVYSNHTNQNLEKMKLSLVIALFCVTFGYAAPLNSNPTNEKEKNKKENKEGTNVNSLVSRNFHSIKKWKMTIEYSNGDIISKTIEISEKASSSAMELAFVEAEKYIKTLKKVKSYHVSPVSANSFVLLAGGK